MPTALQSLPLGFDLCQTIRGTGLVYLPWGSDRGGSAGEKAASTDGLGTEMLTPRKVQPVNRGLKRVSTPPDETTPAPTGRPWSYLRAVLIIPTDLRECSRMLESGIRTNMVAGQNQVKGTQFAFVFTKHSFCSWLCELQEKQALNQLSSPCRSRLAKCYLEMYVMFTVYFLYYIRRQQVQY